MPTFIWAALLVGATLIGFGAMLVSYRRDRAAMSEFMFQMGMTDDLEPFTRPRSRRERKAKSAALAPRRIGPNAVNLGAQDLIRLADYALKNGGEVATFLISDEQLEPFAVPREAAASSKMIEILKTFGADELIRAAQNEFSDLYISGADIVAPSGDLVLVRRREYFVGTDALEAKQFLLAALEELQVTHTELSAH